MREEERLCYNTSLAARYHLENGRVDRFILAYLSERSIDWTWFRSIVPISAWLGTYC